MAWQTPKTDWGVEAIPTTYYNKVEGNDVVLHKGNGHTSLVALAANASNQLDINSTDETFVINDDTYEIGLILTEDREPGCHIYLIADGASPYIISSGTPSGNYKSIKISAGGSSQQILYDSVAMLIYYNSYWYLFA